MAKSPKSSVVSMQMFRAARGDALSPVAQEVLRRIASEQIRIWTGVLAKLAQVPNTRLGAVPFRKS